MVDVQIARQLTEQVSRLRQRQTAPLILELDLTDGISEGPVTDPLSAIMSRRRLKLTDIIEGLRRARQDDRVRALVVKVGGGRIGLARMQDIRGAVTAFRETGKLAVAWSETFGEFTDGNVPYYLATAFDRIYLQPSGSVGLTGVAVEQLFLHDALAKIGVGFQSAKRYEYKSAADNLTERGFTGPAREATERLAVSVAEQITAAIAERRGKTPKTPARCSTAGRSSPKKRWPRVWSTRSATGTRSTRTCARRRARMRSCSTSPATSGGTCWPSGPASCRTRVSVSSR